MNDIKWVAEIGSNHNQDWNRCVDLIRKAKDFGFWGVKFQLFKAELLTKDIEKQKIYKQQELPIEWIPEIRNLCKDFNLNFGCTPFDLESIDILFDYVDFLKISSFDILRKDLIKKCFDTGLTIMISTGLAYDSDIERIIKLFDETLDNAKLSWFDIYFLHCVSKYPTQWFESKIGRIKDIRDQCSDRYFSKYLHVGYSDHTNSICTIIKSINFGAEAIEVHFDLDDKEGSEYKHGHCWTPSDIRILQDFALRDEEILSQSDYIITDEDRKQLADPTTGLRG